jgi:poly-gamma-glutamate synthesis protein (capsule biosynthesis protein)
MMPREDLEAVREAVEKTGINGYNKILINEGYALPSPDGVYEFGDTCIVAGDKSTVVYEPATGDVERALSAVREAKLSSDYVIVSLHNHQVIGEDKSEVPEFLSSLCHRLIDEGADAIIGHGPHLLRAVEIYNSRPIFYSLGDFLIQLYDVDIAPAEFYAKYGVDNRAPAIELLKKRSHNFTRGLMEDTQMLEAVIPYWETDKSGAITKLTMLPVKAAKGQTKAIEGLPQPCSGLEFFDRFKALCIKHGTTLEYIDGKFEVKL